MSDLTDIDPGSTDFTSLKAHLLSVVLERAYRRSDEPFTLSSGGTSHDYVDMRRGLSKGDALEIAALTVLSATASRSISFDAVGGMTMGADPVADAIALLTDRSWFSVRKAEKSYGARQRIEGAELFDSLPTLLFEDTVSTGRSLIEALDIVAATGAEIVAAVTLLDRGDTAAPMLAERNIEYVSILSYRDLGIDSISQSSP